MKEVWEVMICRKNHGRHVQGLWWMFLVWEKLKSLLLSSSMPLPLPRLLIFRCNLVYERINPQLEQELNQQIPHFNLPPKILCHVVYIQLKAEPETDEVYAQITLQIKLSPRARIHQSHLFNLFDMSQPTPAQDLHGYDWRFKHIFRGDTYLQLDGVCLSTSKRLAAVFLRGDNGELRTLLDIKALCHRLSFPVACLQLQHMLLQHIPYS